MHGATMKITDLFPTQCSLFSLFHYLWFISYKYLFLNMRKQFKGLS